MKDNTFENLPEVMSDDKDFDTMVETLEENEDMVECKECFELFPKADCTRVEHGYICPTCGQGIIHEDGPEVSTSDITVDLYDQDFPDAMDYDPDVAPMVAERAADFKDMFDALLKDEFAAIDGYDVAIEAADHSDLENREEVIDTLDHIRAEEEEHIDELRALCPECEKTDDEDDELNDSESEDLEEELFKLTGDPAIDKYNNAVRYAKRDKVPYLYGYTKADGEAFFPVRPIKVEGSQTEFEKKYREENPDADTLRFAYPDKSFKESIGSLGGKPIWFCYFNGRDLGTVEADTEDEAYLAMEQAWPEYNFNNEDVQVVQATEEEMENLLYESYKTLFEQKLEELWTYPKAGKTVDKVCKTNGYTIAILGEDGTVASASTKRTARTLKDALTTAQNLSKLEPDEMVYVIANAIPEAELKMLPKPFLKFFDQKPGSKYAIVLTRFFRGAEDENSSKIRAFHNNYATAINVTKQSKDAGAEPEADIRGGEETPDETPVAETFKVTFDSAEGSAVEAAEVKKGEKVAKPADPTREGHTFKGWFNGDTEFNFDTAITADITLTAKWETTTPDADPVDDSDTGISELDEEAPAVPAEVAELLDKTLGGASAKYYFRLYDAEGAMSGKTKIFGPLTKVLDYLISGAGKSAKATLFYPVDIMSTVMGDKAADIIAWFNANLKDLKDPTGKANPKKAILLTNFNEGIRVEDGGDNLTIIINKFAELKAIIDKEAVPGEVDDDEGGEEPPVTEPKPETFTVTFTDDGKSTEVTVNKGEKVTKPEDPTREGFEFKGWFNGEAAYDFETPVTADLTLTAKWEEKKPDDPGDDGDDESEVDETPTGLRHQEGTQVTRNHRRDAGLELGKWLANYFHDIGVRTDADVRLAAEEIGNFLKDNKARFVFGESFTSRFLQECERATDLNSLRESLETLLKENAEEDEERVTCSWCFNEVDRSDCRQEVDLGWLCSKCVDGIKSRGETLTFKEELTETLPVEIPDETLANCQTHADFEVWGTEPADDNVYKATLLKRFENMDVTQEQDVYDEMYDINGFFTFMLDKNGEPELVAWNVELLNNFGPAEITFEDERYEMAAQKVFNKD